VDPFFTCGIRRPHAASSRSADRATTSSRYALFV
jgi:hypothetical protein